MDTDTKSETFHWRFAAPPDAIWPILSDTARFNEAARLPKHQIEEIELEDKSMLFIGDCRMGPFHLRWCEIPTNWVTGKWFWHRRDFEKGPLRSMSATFKLFPDGSGSRGEFVLEAIPRGLIGWLLLKFGFFSSTAKTFGDLAVDADKFATGATSFAFTYAAPTPTDLVRERATDMVERVEASGNGHGLARRLADHVFTAQEVDLVHLRPLALARVWARRPRELIELFLQSSREGLLDLRWDLMCPRCRVPKASADALDQLPEGAHCDTCNIDYSRDFARNVELSFAPAPTIRPLEAGEYCLSGPQSTPHVLLQLTLKPGEEMSVDLDLVPGRYRFRTLETGPETAFDVAEDIAPILVLADDGPTTEAGSSDGLVLQNWSTRELTAILEELSWTRDALTADRAATLQAFRDLFSDQVLRPGDEVGVGRVCLLFTDLGGSTALYNDIGDASAYHLVREHFAFLAGIVREHDGAVVKTIGDAVMAAFSDPLDGVAERLAGLTLDQYEMMLRGFAKPIRFHRAVFAE